eukprot:5738569-Prymnesium_polylepis.1
MGQTTTRANPITAVCACAAGGDAACDVGLRIWREGHAARHSAQRRAQLRGGTPRCRQRSRKEWERVRY